MMPRGAQGEPARAPRGHSRRLLGRLPVHGGKPAETAFGASDGMDAVIIPVPGMMAVVGAAGSRRPGRSGMAVSCGAVEARPPGGRSECGLP